MVAAVPQESPRGNEYGCALDKPVAVDSAGLGGGGQAELVEKWSVHSEDNAADVAPSEEHDLHAASSH